MSKSIGRRSSAQDNFIGPNPVTNLTATDVGSNRAFNDGRVDLSWTNPTSGNTPVGYKIIRDGNQIATVNHPSNTFSYGGLPSGANYSYVVRAFDDFNDSANSNTATVTVTTVPQTPAAPSASAAGGTATDNVSWTAPNNGGKAITNYNWESTDSKSGNTTATSVNVGQEAGTQQQYRVRAQNDNGYSSFSSYSSLVTSFSFAPFGFTPFGFTPFGFTPFGFTPFGFTPFGFTPFGFTPFGFTPFGFTPYAFSGKGYKSVSSNTLIKTTNGYVPAISLKVGDTLVSADIIDQDTGNTLNQFQYGWSTTNATVDSAKETTVMGLTAYFVDFVYLINNFKYTNTHYFFVKRPVFLNGQKNTSDGNDLIKFMNVTEIAETDLLWSSALQDFAPITGLQIVDQRELVICINTEPYDVFFVDNDILVHDSQPLEHIKQYIVETPGEDLSQALLELYQSVVNEELAIQEATSAVENAESTLNASDLQIAWNKVMVLHSEPWDLVENGQTIKANLIVRLNALESQING
jgi:hypothetical protein